MPFKKKSVTSANKKSPTAKKSPVVKKTSSKSETTSKPSKKGGLTAIMFLIKGRKVFADITGDVKFPHTSVQLETAGKQLEDYLVSEMGVTITKPYMICQLDDTVFFLAYSKDDMMHQPEGDYKQHYLDDVVRILESKKSKGDQTIHVVQILALRLLKMMLDQKQKQPKATIDAELKKMLLNLK